MNKHDIIMLLALVFSVIFYGLATCDETEEQSYKQEWCWLFYTTFAVFAGFLGIFLVNSFFHATKIWNQIFFIVGFASGIIFLLLNIRVIPSNKYFALQDILFGAETPAGTSRQIFAGPGINLFLPNWIKTTVIQMEKKEYDITPETEYIAIEYGEHKLAVLAKLICIVRPALNNLQVHVDSSTEESERLDIFKPNALAATIGIVSRTLNTRERTKILGHESKINRIIAEGEHPEIDDLIKAYGWKISAIRIQDFKDIDSIAKANEGVAQAKARGQAARAYIEESGFELPKDPDKAARRIREVETMILADEGNANIIRIEDPDQSMSPGGKSHLKAEMVSDGARRKKGGSK